MVPVEMSADSRFARRVRRLIAVSAVALGVITLLARDHGASAMAMVLLAVGWVTMPSVLAASLRVPRMRYLLVVPAAATILGLLLVSTSSADAGLVPLGWWSITAGVGLGGVLGVWFWYRWMPVPRRLEDPFAGGRWALITVHVAAVAVGVVLVALG
jgi:hypothetical protein